MSARLRLNCLIDGEVNGFTVTAVCSDDVGDLKNKIKGKCAATFEGVDAHNLALWKLKDSNPLTAQPDDTLVKRIGSLGRDVLKFADKLGSTITLFSIFPTQPSRDNIHIIVKHSRTPAISPSGSNESNASSTGGRPAGESTHLLFFRLLSGFGPELTALHHEDQKLPSNHPLHELWMLARDDRERLFETCPVQRDKSCPSTETNLPSDCRVLKGGDWVRKLQPESRFTGVLMRDEYAEALRAVMKWFLSRDEATEDAMEVDGVAPAPFENPFLRLPVDSVSKQRGFVLSGDPGIGKTAFLYVLLVLRLQAQLPTIYQSRDTYLYYFANDGVYRINLIPSPIDAQFHESTWCLIDSNQSLGTVPVFIQDLGLFIVQASSLSPGHLKWARKTTGPVLQYFMKPWSLSELLVGRVLQEEVYSEAQIKFFSDHYGHQARSVYANAPNPLKYERTLLQKMSRISYEDMGKSFREALPLDLVTISPGDTRYSLQLTFPTRYVYEKFRDRFSTHKLEAAARLYEVFVRNPETRVPAGFMLEDAANAVFPRGGEWSLVPMMRSGRTSSKNTHWKNPNNSITPQYLHLGYLGHHIAIDTTPHPDGTVYQPLPLKCFLPGDRLQLKNGYYYPSSRSQQETFDAFIYESASKTATVFQVTTSPSHTVKEGGIEWLRGLGVERFRYIAVTTPHTSFDFPFPNKWEPELIPDKYILTVDRLPKH